jgi:hypothetical protein
VDSSDAWRSFFETWPETLPHQGILVTVLNETIPFVNFLISSSLLMVERDKPDTYGSRKVIVSYDAISVVKLTSPEELSKFEVMGFQKTI